jgi:hypothetical protein
MSTEITRPVFDLIPRSLERRTAQDIARIEHEAMVKVAANRALAIEVSEMIHEVNAVTHEAMTGHAMLVRWSDALAQGDPIVSSDMRFFTDVARLGAGEIIADLVEAYSRRGRR